MANDNIQIINVETDEVIIREMTDEEQAFRNAEVAEYAAKVASDLSEAEAVAQAKLDAVEKLTALGIDPKALGL